jgi:outer membrane protein OmpA-like peptidoglycan-associated protein
LQPPVGENETRDSLPFQFALGDASLPPMATLSLQELLVTLRNRPDLRVTLVGHADSSGTDAINDRLSIMRALTAYEFLVSLDASLRNSNRIAFRGAGARELRPDLAACDGRQRRLELRLARGV